jgi:hypothetical protein
MNEQFKQSWNTSGKKFTPTDCEWLVWIGQPMLYDGGLCVNRTLEEHVVSQQQRGSLLL